MNCSPSGGYDVVGRRDGAGAARRVGAARAGGAPAAVHHAGGEASLVVPDLSSVSFGGVDGHTLLLSGLVICALGLLFGLMTFTQLKNLPVHSSMREVSELIYETCKTYLITQGKFILHPVGVHRGHHRRVFRLAVAGARQAGRR